MTEDDIKDEFNLTDEELSEVEVEQEETAEHVEEAPKASKYDEEAKSSGWKPLDEWVAEGKDPDDHVSAKEYIRYGKLQSSMREFESKFEERLKNQAKLLEYRHQQELDALRGLQRQAVETGDVDAYDAYTKRIEDHQMVFDAPKQQSAPQPGQLAPEDQEALDSWMATNTYIYNPKDEKSIAANGMFDSYRAANPNASIQEALKHVDRLITRAFPEVNPRRELPSTVEASRPPAKKDRGMSWNDLTRSEQNECDQLIQAGMFKDRNEYIKTISDDKKARG